MIQKECTRSIKVHVSEKTKLKNRLLYQNKSIYKWNISEHNFFFHFNKGREIKLPRVICMICPYLCLDILICHTRRRFNPVWFCVCIRFQYFLFFYPYILIFYNSYFIGLKLHLTSYFYNTIISFKKKPFCIKNYEDCIWHFFLIIKA